MARSLCVFLIFETYPNLQCIAFTINEPDLDMFHANRCFYFVYGCVISADSLEVPQLVTILVSNCRILIGSLLIEFTVSDCKPLSMFYSDKCSFCKDADWLSYQIFKRIGIILGHNWCGIQFRAFSRVFMLWQRPAWRQIPFTKTMVLT